MSKANKMFEELGYKKVEDNETEIVYEFNKILMGDKCIHKLLFIKVSKLVFSFGEDLEENYGFTMQELKAINKKVKELGWI